MGSILDVVLYIKTQVEPRSKKIKMAFFENQSDLAFQFGIAPKQQRASGINRNQASTLQNLTEIRVWERNEHYWDTVVNGEESNCEQIQIFYYEVVRVCSFVSCNGVCKSSLSSIKLNSNDTLQRDTRRFNAAFSDWIPSVSVVQFTIQMSKLNGLGNLPRAYICCRN